MAPYNKTILNNIFDLTYPWKATVTEFSNNYSCVGFDLDYNSEKILCPLCGICAEIDSRCVVTLDFPDIFYGVSAKMTAYLPVSDGHNVLCKAHRDPMVLCNTLLLDIILKQLRNTPNQNPFSYLFNAVVITAG
jgi:hypothetical protein